MFQYNRANIVWMAMQILIVSIICLIGIAGILVYIGSFNTEVYGDWLFYIAIGFISLGVVPGIGIVTSNNCSIQYGESMVKGSVDAAGKYGSGYKAVDRSFYIVLSLSGVLIFIASIIMDRLS